MLHKYVLNKRKLLRFFYSFNTEYVICLNYGKSSHMMLLKWFMYYYSCLSLFSVQENLILLLWIGSCESFSHILSFLGPSLWTFSCHDWHCHRLSSYSFLTYSCRDQSFLQITVHFLIQCSDTLFCWPFLLYFLSGIWFINTKFTLILIFGLLRCLLNLLYMIYIKEVLLVA